MELLQVQPKLEDTQISNIELLSTSKPFIEANTIESTLAEINDKHLIPVFIKDNEPTISMAEFIELTTSATKQAFASHQILSPSIRLSHPVKGRIPDAKDKPAALLQEHEKTLYYERLAFVIEVPSITKTINGNTLALTIGGVKAYNLDNLYTRKGSLEHFKMFVTTQP
jgi:Domain of unknown function, B. Theta Gene description (DUF3871)